MTTAIIGTATEAARAGEIIATKSCAEAMGGFTPETMAGLMKGAADLGDLGKFFS